MSSVYGNILDAGRIEKAFLTTYEKWFQDYSTRLESVNELRPGTLVQPKAWETSNSFDTIKGENLPKLIVISPGLKGAPRLHNKQYSATWNVGVGVAFSARTQVEAEVMVKLYAAIARTIPLHNMTLDNTIPGIVEIRWADESYDDLPINDQINLYKAAGVYFEIDIEDVVTKWAGPDSPGLGPDQDFGQAQLVEVELIKDDITDD